MRRPSDSHFLETATHALRGMASPRLSMAELGSVLDVAHPVTRRVLANLSPDGGLHVDRAALVEVLEQLEGADDRALLRRAFDLHDLDGNGSLQESEVREILVESLAGYRVLLQDAQIDALSHLLFGRCDGDGDGSITFAELDAVLEPHPDLRAQMGRTAITCLQPAPRTRASAGLSTRDRLRPVVRNYPLLLVGLGVYVGIQLLLFWQAASHYAELGANLSIQIARGSAACISFNGALILLPVMRHFVSWLRTTALRHWLPIDQNLSLHRLLGHVLFGLGLVHTAAHLHNYSLQPDGLLASMTATQAGLTGLALLGCFGLMWAAALDVVRQRGAFELFYFTHLLFVGWFLLLLAHGPDFWKWALLPGGMFLVEAVVRAKRRKPEVPVLATTPLPSGVTRLTVARPEGFAYEAGDYLFVRDPRLARHEWHPFTITSCPEDLDRVELHIRSRGNWTRRLHELACAEVEQPRAEAARVCLDGPYGTPSGHIYDSTNVVLIGAGIGVTPFVSILQSIHRRRQQAGTEVFSLKRVHFLWLNRSHRAFEWFTDLLGELERANEDGFFDFGIYMTGVKDTDRASLLDIAMRFHHEQGGTDLLTGLAHRTRLGRPDWDALFGEWADSHAGEPVDIYFCGPLPLGRELRRQAFERGFGFHMERF